MTKNNISLIISSSLMIIGTSVGAGILALPLETGLSGFIPSLLSFILVWIAMTVSGCVIFSKFYNHKGKIKSIAKLYHYELGAWAKHINTIFFLLTFYGLLIAYISGATATLSNLFTNTGNNAEKVITIIFFIFCTSIIIFGQKILNRCNVTLTITLFSLFFILIFILIPHADTSKLSYINLYKAGKDLPILITAFGFHLIIPVIYEHTYKKGLIEKNYLQILLIGTTAVLLINLFWSAIVMSILPLESTNDLSITAALKNGTPATVPLAKLLNIKSLLFIATLFSILAITTSYIGVGAGLLNYVEGFLAYYVKPSRSLSISVTFLIPLIFALIYPGIFVKLLNFVGGVGIITSSGILPGLIGIKRNNPFHIKILSYITILFCIIVFYIECSPI